jgi:hypothetical protein
MLRCFTSKVEGSQRTRVKHFNKVDDVPISNKGVLEFDVDDLDFFFMMMLLLAGILIMTI